MENSKYVVEMEAYDKEMPTPKSKKMVKTTTPGASRLEMLDENVVLKPIDIKTPSQNALDKRFGNEDKDVVFSFATFCEEAFVQTSFAFLGPLCWLWAIPICTLNGLKITGFYPGELIKGSSWGGFISQTMGAYATTLPLLVFLYMYLSGTLPTYPENSILPTTYIFIPVMVIIARQVVIAVKYAFIPRRRMRQERKTTRRNDEMEDDLLASWMMKPRNESLAHQLDLALWRSGLTGDDEIEYITFASPVPPEIIDAINLPEKTPPKPTKETANAKAVDDPNKTLEHEVENATKLDVEDVGGQAQDCHSRKESRVSTNKIPLRMLIKYATFTGTVSVTMPFSIIFTGLILLASMPLVFLGINGKPLFGDPGNSLEQYVCAVGWIHCFMQFPSNMLMFPLAPFVIFKRTRFCLNQYFELLVPSTVIDVCMTLNDYGAPINNFYTNSKSYSLLYGKTHVTHRHGTMILFNWKICLQDYPLCNLHREMC